MGLAPAETIPYQCRVRICLIFNPAAKGDKARTLRRHLELFQSQCTLRETTAVGAGRTLAAKAVEDGFETIIAAGGDGTINEVLNGIGDVPEGFAQARLAVLPLGTVNVFAREIRMPFNPVKALAVIAAGREQRIDLGIADFINQGKAERRYFIQLAGSGLDALAIEKVDWHLKKKLGPLAYVWAGLKALQSPAAKIRISAHAPGEIFAQVLIGNGAYYGGSIRVFPRAGLNSGKIDVLGLRQFGLLTLLKAGFTLPFGRHLQLSEAFHFQTDQFRMESDAHTGLELDGELAGELPATLSVRPAALRIVVP